MNTHSDSGATTLRRRLALGAAAFVLALVLLFALFALLAHLPGRGAPRVDGAPPGERPTTDVPAPPLTDPPAPTLDEQLAALAPQRPGHRDLFVLAIAGDGSERVFRNEVLYLRDLATQRLDAGGHVVVLANHPPSDGVPVLPPATTTQVRAALAGLRAQMDPDEDVLLLYVTTHGSPDHDLLLRQPGADDRHLRPNTLRSALDGAGIRHRVVVISACFAGGYADALADDDTLVLMAARRDRASFGCGDDSAATYFGRAWLVDALAQDVDFIAGFERAKAAITAREQAEDRLPSRPQIAIGANIAATLADWRAGFEPGPAPAYPHGEATPIAVAPDAEPGDDEDRFTDEEILDERESPEDGEPNPLIEKDRGAGKS